VTSIGNSAFSYCLSLISVIIPESVTSIGERGFSYCLSLTSVSIPNSVTSIGEGAFYYCLSLVSVTIPESVTSIGNDAFFGCDSLTVIEVLENNAVYASENGVLFNKTKTTLVLYPEGKTDENYTIPNSVTSIGERAFFYCRSLPSVTIPENVTSIGYAAFSFCSSLTSIIISENVTSIGEYAFSGCRSLPSVTIPESVISIGYAAFNSCRSLTSVIISENMTSIGDYAFYNCSSLILVTNLNPTPQEINLNVFGSVAIDKVVLSVPAKSVETYKAAPVWQDFKIITACTPSAINTPAIANAVRIYPDPSTESFRIDGLTTPTQVSITDISGKTLLQQTVKGEENIFVGHLPQGIYLIRVNGETTKIIKTF
jgi:hypothetical protein